MWRRHRLASRGLRRGAQAAAPGQFHPGRAGRPGQRDPRGQRRVRRERLRAGRFPVARRRRRDRGQRRAVDHLSCARTARRLPHHRHHPLRRRCHRAVVGCGRQGDRAPRDRAAGRRHARRRPRRPPRQARRPSSKARLPGRPSPSDGRSSRGRGERCRRSGNAGHDGPRSDDRAAGADARAGHRDRRQPRPGNRAAGAGASGTGGAGRECGGGRTGSCSAAGCTRDQRARGGREGAAGRGAARARRAGRRAHRDGRRRSGRLPPRPHPGEAPADRGRAARLQAVLVLRRGWPAHRVRDRLPARVRQALDRRCRTP